MEMNEKIKKLRTERNMTLEQVGNIVGVGRSTVRKWESGSIKNMRRDKIAKLAEALGTTPSYLIGWEDDDDSLSKWNKLSKATGTADEVKMYDIMSNHFDEYICEFFSDFTGLDPTESECRQMLDYAKYLVSKRK